MVGVLVDEQLHEFCGSFHMSPNQFRAVGPYDTNDAPCYRGPDIPVFTVFGLGLREVHPI